MKTLDRPRIKKASDSYLKLIEKFPLRRIKADSEYNAAVEVVSRLAIRGEDDLDEGETEYLDTLSTLITVYDEEHFPDPPDTSTPLQRLKALMEFSETTPSKLGDIIGSRPTASMVLRGKRQLSKAHIRKLAAHFKLQADYFL